MRVPRDRGVIKLHPFRDESSAPLGKRLRNAPANHAVAPYSLRPLPGAPVAAPLRWEEAIGHAASEFRRIQAKYGKRSVGGITSSRCTNEETFLVQKLVRDGLVEMRKRPGDRRSSIVSMTAEGKQQFGRLAKAHSDWIDQMLGDLNFTQRERLYVALGVLKLSIAKAASRRRSK